jgi:hypothetical protein
MSSGYVQFADPLAASTRSINHENQTRVDGRLSTRLLGTIGAREPSRSTDLIEEATEHMLPLRPYPEAQLFHYLGRLVLQFPWRIHPDGRDSTKCDPHAWAASHLHHSPSIDM